jgi:hypothetical protein
MVLLKLKHVYRSKDRQGRDRWLLRLPGRKAITLKGAHGPRMTLLTSSKYTHPHEEEMDAV